MAAKGGHLLSAGHCSVCLPETPIVFLTGVSNGRVFAFCARCGVAWADPPSRFLGGNFGRAEVLSGGRARAATEKEIDEHGWFQEIEGTVPESVEDDEGRSQPTQLAALQRNTRDVLNLRNLRRCGIASLGPVQPQYKRSFDDLLPRSGQP